MAQVILARGGRRSRRSPPAAPSARPRRPAPCVGAADKNGPVIIPLTQSANGEWSVPAGAKLTAEKSYKAGELYVNVHTDADKGGEIRAQLSP